MELFWLSIQTPGSFSFFEKLLREMSSVPETAMDRKRNRQNSLNKSTKARWRRKD